MSNEYGAYGYKDYPSSLLSKEVDRYGNRRWAVTSSPSVEPATKAEVKLWGRIDGSLDDDMIDNIIISARQAAELYTGRAFINQTIQVFMDYWPTEALELPVGPLFSMVSVAYLDEDDTATEYDSDNYYAVDTGQFPKVIIKNGSAYPYNADRRYSGYRIEYKAGYGSAATSVPMQICNAIKLWSVQIYESRIPVSEPPTDIKKMLDPYRVMRL